MSRFIAPLKGMSDRLTELSKTHLAYGFDDPLQHYFYIIFENGEAVGNREGSKNIFFDPPYEGGLGFKPGESRSVYQLYDIPEDHATMLAMDLPI